MLGTEGYGGDGLPGHVDLLRNELAFDALEVVVDETLALSRIIANDDLVLV